MSLWNVYFHVPGPAIDCGKVMWDNGSRGEVKILRGKFYSRLLMWFIKDKETKTAGQRPSESTFLCLGWTLDYCLSILENHHVSLYWNFSWKLSIYPLYFRRLWRFLRPLPIFTDSENAVHATRNGWLKDIPKWDVARSAVSWQQEAGKCCLYPERCEDQGTNQLHKRRRRTVSLKSHKKFYCGSYPSMFKSMSKHLSIVKKRLGNRRKRS